MDICITCINKHANNSIKICIDEENNNRNDILYQNYVKERQIKYSRHEHYLKKCKFNNLTTCNICNKAYLKMNFLDIVHYVILIVVKNVYQMNHG